MSLQYSSQVMIIKMHIVFPWVFKVLHIILLFLQQHCKVGHPKNLYSEVSPIEFNRTYSQIYMHRIAVHDTAHMRGICNIPILCQFTWSRPYWCKLNVFPSNLLGFQSPKPKGHAFKWIWVVLDCTTATITLGLWNMERNSHPHDWNQPQQETGKENPI